MKQNKISIVIAVLFFASMTIYSAWNDLSSDQQQLDNAVLVEDRLQHITKINEIITELQKERGLTAIYNADANENITAALLTQRQITTKLLTTAKKTEDIKDIIVKRNKIIQQISTQDLNQTDTFKQYTFLIKRVMEKSGTLVFSTNNSEIKNALILYHLLKNAQENLGNLRAKIGTVLVTKTLTADNYKEIITHNAVYHIQITKVQVHQTFQLEHQLQKMQKLPCVQETFTVVDQLINGSIESITLSPLEWFQLSTCSVNSVVDTAQEHLEQIQINAKLTTQQAESALMQHLLFWVGGGLTLVLLLIISLNRSKELTKKHQLLENYQEAIDYSTIVSKADKNGVITYVNSAFCDISGYDTDELLHRPHNIVRHPDMPKEVFEVMWETLKEGKRWNGIVKNLKKDGTSYWVDASISPIFDENGELLEYISIRRDVTDIILLNEEIRHTQSELIYRMGEAVESRSKESGHHIQRVAHYSKLLAHIAGLNKEECEIIFSASTMHDIGKLSIPDAILLKAESLTDEEWTVMRTHAEVGYKILEGSERPLLKMAATVAYEHHEHFDGNGYPRGLKADEISIYGRIVAIADVFDALATDRIYKKAWPLKEIFEHLKEQSGKQFDPELIELVLNHLDQFLEIKSKFKDQ
jgi:PAS domain S-box-containing protein